MTKLARIPAANLLAFETLTLSIETERKNSKKIQPKAAKENFGASANM